MSIVSSTNKTDRHNITEFVNSYNDVIECGREWVPVESKQRLYTSGICCFFAKHVSLRRKSNDWLARNQDNVSEWSDMSIRGLTVIVGNSTGSTSKDRNSHASKIPVVFVGLCSPVFTIFGPSDHLMKLFQKLALCTKLDILGGYLCWWTICNRGDHPPSSQRFGTDIVYYRGFSIKTKRN